MNDYAQLNTIPAIASTAFIIAGLFTFGGISSFDLIWLSYTVTSTHSMVISLAVYVIAFMSSDTKNFQYYDRWEQAFILGTPAVILLWEYMTEFKDFIIGIGDPLGAQLLFAVTIVGWMVAVR